LIEHFAGAFPLWLAPVQIRVANIRDEQAEDARRAATALKAEGFRVYEDIGPGNIKQKVKDSEEEKVPYLLLLGEREAASNSVAVRARGRRDLGTMPLQEFIERAKQERAERT